MAKMNYKNIVAGAALLASSLVPQFGKAQSSNLETKVDSVKIQRGLQAGQYKGETKTHFLYEFGFNKDLKQAVHNADKPVLYTTDPKSHLNFNQDSSAVVLQYHKSNFDENGTGKAIGLTLKDKDKISVCYKAGLGSKTNLLPSIYWKPTNLFGKESKEVSKNTPKNTLKNTTIIYNSTKITNNYNLTVNEAQDSTKKVKESKLKLLVEGNKSLTNNLDNVTISPQFKITNGFSLGPYATIGFGKEKISEITDVDKTTLINENLGLSTRTHGTISEEMTYSQPFGFGLRAELDSKNKRWMANLDLGVTSSARTDGKLSMRGFDEFIRNGKVTESKEYCYEDGFENTTSDLVPRIALSANYFPIKNTGLFIGAEVNHTFNKKDERFLGKQKDTNFMAKIGWRFGGNRR